MRKQNSRLLSLFFAISLASASFAQTSVTLSRKANNNQPEERETVADFKQFAVYSHLSKAAREIFFPQQYCQELLECNPALKERMEKMKSVPRYLSRTDGYGDDGDLYTSEDGYKFTGLNNNAGGIDSWGTGIPGLVDFNIKPFAADTVITGSRVSRYLLYANGRVYTFVPVYSSDYSSVNGIDCFTLNPLTWKMLDSVRVSASSFADVPYLSAFDKKNGIVYSITLDESTGDDLYYLNTLDMKTFRLKRLAYLGGYSFENAPVKKRVLTPKSLVYADGSLYMLDSGKALYTINTINGDLTKVATFTFPYADEAYGLQGLCYDESEGVFLYNFNSLWTGAIFYNVNLEGGEDFDQVTVDSVGVPNSNYHYIFEKPDSSIVNNDRIKSINDLTVSIEGTSANVSFTVPDSTEGGLKVTDAAVRSLSVYAYVDGTYQVLSDAVQSNSQLGQKITTTLNGLGNGRHVITFSCSYNLNYPYSITYEQPQNSSKIVFVGNDVPVAVGNPKASINNNIATISWTAPTEGQNSQFGAVFDGSKLAYTVIRTFDNDTIAKNITDTKCTDSDIDGSNHSYSYDIIASCDGHDGDMATTNSVKDGTYSKLPYSQDFENSDCFDFFTVISPDNSGRPWFWSNVLGAAYDRFNNKSAKNEWLITPTFHLDNSHVYLFSYSYAGGRTGRYTQNLKVTMGQGNTVADQTTCLIDHNEFCSPDKTSEKHYIKVNNTGSYNFGFYDYSDRNQFYVMIDDIAMKEYTSVEAPDSVTELTATAAEAGKLKATLSFIVPTKCINGENLSSVTKAEIMQGDSVIATLENITPGSRQTYQATTRQGTNVYSVVVYNDKGIGLPASINLFTGNDVAQKVKNYKLTWGSDDNTVNMTWNAVSSVGKNGGYVDASAVKYNIYSYDDKNMEYTLLKGGITGDSISYKENDLTSQAYKTYYIAASNAQGESDYVSMGINLGKPYALAFNESLNGGITTSPWLTNAFVGKCAWVADRGNFDLSVPIPSGTGAYFLLRNTTQQPAGAYITTPMINLGTAENPRLTLLTYHSANACKGSYIDVTVSTDGSNFDNAIDTISLDDNGGWQKHYFDLSSYKGKKVLLKIDGYLADQATRIFMTDVTADNATGNDVAVTGISTEGLANIGGKQNVKVLVSNTGAKPANDYILDLYDGNGTVIGEYISEGLLQPSKTDVLNFIVPVTAANASSLKIYAKVDYEEDENPANNVSDTISIVPNKVLLPVPTNLQANETSDKVKLTWTAPDIKEGLVMKNDLESLRPFTLDNFDGWTTVDGDGENTTSFSISTNGNDWPNIGQPIAWEVWDPELAGTNEDFLAYSGHKALASFQSNGYYPGLKRAKHVNDDWLISPVLQGGSSLTFHAISLFSSTSGESTLEILYSADAKDTADFKTLQTVVLGKNADDEWENVAVTVPQDAKYIAIRNIATNYGIMIDDLDYTLAATPVLSGYNVYRNDVLVNNAIVNDTQYTMSTPKGNYTFGVSALYDLGESDLSNIVSSSTGIIDVATGVSLSVVNGGVFVKGASGKSIFAYMSNGVEQAHIACASDNEFIPLTSGIYILHVDKICFKILVK